ncbi:hypothetical protein GBA52_028400 [Prunus armeniaca]|nr:hypothetical protein GBA52_028400 [Prunus armeniaca]
MDLRNAGNFFAVLEDMLDLAEQEPEKPRNNNHPSRAYVRDAKAMAATPADVVEYPNAYVFVVDMPGIEAGQIKVQVENDNVLVLSGKRRREEEIKESGVKVREDGEEGWEVHEEVCAAGECQFGCDFGGG